MKWLLAVFSFFVAFSVNATTNRELFRVRHDVVVKADEWPSTVTRVQPIEFSRELVAHDCANCTKKVQANSAQSEKFSLRIEGIEHTLVREKWEGFYRVEGARWLSHFSNVNEAVAGEIWLPNGEHRSLITRRGTTYLVEWDDETVAKSLTNDVMFAEENAASARKRRAVRHPANPDACAGDIVETIDQLVLYTPQALAWFGSGIQAEQEMLAVAQNGVDATNATVINSTGEWNYRLRMVYLAKVNYDDGSSRGEKTMSGDIIWLAGSEDVKNLMVQRGADSAYLLAGFYTEAGGLASYGRGFAVSPVHIGALSIIHENGHALWSMNHNPENDFVPPGIPIWAVDHFVDGVARGVMAYANLCTRGCPWQPVFANPGVFYPGTQVPSGIKDQRENWRMLELKTSEVAGIRLSGNEKQCIASTGGFAMLQQESTFF